MTKPTIIFLTKVLINVTFTNTTFQPRLGKECDAQGISKSQKPEGNMFLLIYAGLVAAEDLKKMDIPWGAPPKVEAFAVT